jgi:hypothetical protein
MKLKPWYQVVYPREDLRDGQALDASEFAVHLDEVHAQQGAEVYRNPAHFFERTYLTANLLDFAAEVVRRLAGIKLATSPCFSMTTQFGGGKTHALTLLYHLAHNGPAAEKLQGVARILEKAGISNLPKAKVAVFVGQNFDPRGGDDGTPLRRTPWGEIAWQLGGEAGYQLLAAFDQDGSAPGGDTLARLFTLIDQPVLILMDELINYISRKRQYGMAAQSYNFVQNLSEVVRSRANIVLAVSLPKSMGEITAEDQADHQRLAHLLNRVSKGVIMSAESDAAEIIRRRLFEWDEFTPDGRVHLPREAIDTCRAYAEWLQQHRSQLPTWFANDNALAEFKNTYPFHPALISVFERKWQSLTSFQRTRGVLRMLALWVAKAYHEGFSRRKGQGDALINLGSAPLDDPIFRQDVFGQLGERNLEIPVTIDIGGSRNANALRLDEEAGDAIRPLQLHRKVATAIFFESNGGMSVTRMPATLQEIRLAVGQPDLEIGNIEIVLEALAPPAGACYYLDLSPRGYWFSMRPNLTRVLAERKERVHASELDDAMRRAISTEVGQLAGFSRVLFPERSSDIPNQPALTVVVLPPEQSLQERVTVLALIDQFTREYGQSARTYKSALIWSVAESDLPLREAAKTLLAWEAIDAERDTLQLSDTQKQQLTSNLGSAKGKVREAVWQSYTKIMLLGKDNQLRLIDLGRHNSSAAPNLLSLIERELVRYDEVTNSVNPQFLVRNWPPAFQEWSGKAIKDAFFASPQFPRIKSDTVIQEAIAKGVANGFLAYVSKLEDGSYVNFVYKESACRASDIAISDSMYVITSEVAEAYLSAQAAQRTALVDMEAPPAGKPINDGAGAYTTPSTPTGEAKQPAPAPPASPGAPTVAPRPQTQPATASKLTWSGSIPAQKWTNFYLKVLTKFASNHEVAVKLQVTISGGDGISPAKVAEMRAALHELGLEETLLIE